MNVDGEPSRASLEERTGALEKQLQDALANAKAKEEAEKEAEAKFELAETSFKTVLDADVYLDNKASRILAALAFLTAASAAVFARAYDNPTLPSSAQADVRAALQQFVPDERLNDAVASVARHSPNGSWTYR
jgi:hypothetical protein